MNKWIVLLAGVLIQTVLGGVYAWSAFVPALKNTYELSNSQCGLIFGMIMGVFTLTMIPAGKMLKKFGPKVLALTGTILFLIGYTLASFSGGNFIILLIGLSVISGAGSGIAYVVPLTIGMKWFPNNKGLVTGVSVAGFGLGALLVSFLAEYLLNVAKWDVLEIFRFIGLAFGSVAIFCSFFLSEPQETEATNKSETKQSLKPYVFSKTFVLYSLGMFSGAFACLLTVSNLKPLVLNLGMPASYAAWVISIFALGNATGRVSWGQVHDWLGSKKTLTLSLLVLFFSLIPFLFALPSALILLSTFIFGICFGSFTVVYASSIVEKYGVEIFPRLYPLCFLQFGLAAITGPFAGGWILDLTKSYNYSIILSMGIVLFAMIIIGLNLYKEEEPQKENVLKRTLFILRQTATDLFASQKSVSVEKPVDVEKVYRTDAEKVLVKK
jgi:OFA family oxalate/formate antiporter-like MFS transporter